MWNTLVDWEGIEWVRKLSLAGALLFCWLIDVLCLPFPSRFSVLSCPVLSRSLCFCVLSQSLWEVLCFLSCSLVLFLSLLSLTPFTIHLLYFLSYSSLHLLVSSSIFSRHQISLYLVSIPLIPSSLIIFPHTPPPIIYLPPSPPSSPIFHFPSLPPPSTLTFHPRLLHHPRSLSIILHHPNFYKHSI